MKIVLMLLLIVQITGNESDTEVSETESEISEVIYYTEEGSAFFTSSVPLHTFTGESGHLTGMIDPEENVVDFYLDLNTLRTGIDRRDRDMFRTLEVDDYPFAEFTGSLETCFDIGSGDPQTAFVVGEFTVHGVTNRVEIEGTLQQQDEGIRLQAEFILMLDDYDIEPPGILFYRVDEELEIRIDAVLDPIPKEEFN